MMDHKDLQAIAQAAAKGIKTQEDLKEFQQMLTKITVEAALNAELDDHLGYARHEATDGGIRVDFSDTNDRVGPGAELDLN